MAKKIIEKLFPDIHKMRNNQRLVDIFGSILHRPNLWHINRNSISKGTAIGFFCAFMPIPMQTVLAVLLAIFMRANIPITAIAVWITNPLTITPIFFFCYKLGALLLNIETEPIIFEISWEWLKNGFIVIWKPLLIGCFVSASTAALISYFFIHLYWRYYIISYWRRRSGLRKRLES